MKSYSIKIADHFKHLWPLLLFIIVMPFIIYFTLMNKLGYIKNEHVLGMAGVLLLFFIIPQIILHINYFLINSKDLLEVDNVSISYTHRGEQIDFTTKEIDTFVIYKTAPFARNGFHIFPWDYYHFVHIKLKNGKELKISSLLVFELEKLIKTKKMVTKKDFYPWIPPLSRKSSSEGNEGRE